MNNRERWVVYPLLVWALSMGFRSQYEALFERDPLMCQEIRVLDTTGKPRIRLRAVPGLGGTIQFFAEDGSPVSVIGGNGAVSLQKPEKSDK